LTALTHANAGDRPLQPTPARLTQENEPALAAVGRIDVLRHLLNGAAFTRPGTRQTGLWRTATHFLRCVSHFELFRQWYANPAHPALQEALAERPSLVMCAVHPYLNTAWTARYRMAVVRQHYALLNGPLSFMRFAPTQSIVLAHAAEGLRVQLDKPGPFEHEGELTINLFSEHSRLYTLVFTLGLQGSHRVAYAGGLQGMHSTDALRTYRDLTHRMNGLRPRDLLVDAFRALCRALGVGRILAISDARRVSSNAYFESSSRVFTSYDSAWAENGGVAGADGFFELSPLSTHRSAEDTPTRKRAQYRRRYTMLDDIALQIGRAVQAS
jgi:uncharacterized protein